MSGFISTSPQADHLSRASAWSATLKDVLEFELSGMRYVKDISAEMAQVDTLNIPSIGQAQIGEYVEDTDIILRAMETGNFQFSGKNYLAGGTYITDAFKHRSYLADELVNSFVPKHQRAIMSKIETDLMALGNSQTLNNPNLINGGAHRFVAGGANGEIVLQDFAKARYALDKAAVPAGNRVAIVDPSVEYMLSTMPNALNGMSPDPLYQRIVNDGISSGMRFITKIFGFDVYVSNYLADTTDTSITAWGDTVSAPTNGKCNLFFSAEADLVPFLFAWTQQPKVESERNIKRQRDEYYVTARYGTGLWRPETLVSIISNVDAVNA